MCFQILCVVESNSIAMTGVTWFEAFVTKRRNREIIE